MTLAWFLYLRNDGFLRATKKNYTPETMGEGPEGLFAPPPAKSKETAFVNPVNSGDNSSYQGAFFTAGIFFLAAATVMYLWGGVGSYYYTPKTFL